MKKLLFVMVSLALALTLTLAPVSAVNYGRLHFTSIQYNYDAEPNDWAIWCTYAGEKDKGLVKGNEFIPDTGETIADLELAIRNNVSQIFYTEEWLNYDNDDPDWRYFLDPPVLHDNEEILDTKPKKVLLRIYLLYFDIHIYSLDDTGTPENELSFITKFSNNPISGEWW